MLSVDPLSFHLSVSVVLTFFSVPLPVTSHFSLPLSFSLPHSVSLSIALSLSNRISLFIASLNAYTWACMTLVVVCLH